MPRLGDTIDPRLFVQDYSGFNQAAQTQAAGMANFANTVGAAGRDYARDQKEAKDALKAGQVQIEAAIKLFPDQAEYLGQIANELKNEDTPLSARAQISKQTADYISMAVGQKRYETDQHYKEKELSFRERDQNMQERESALRQHVTGLNITAAETEAQQAAVDKETQSAIGPGLLDYAINLVPKSVADSVKKQNLDPAESYSMANSLMKLIPKAERRNAPTVTDIPVPGGTQKMQWDENTGAFVPIQTSQPAPASGDPTIPDLPVYTPVGASDEQLGGLLPPVQGAPVKVAPPQRVGFTPSVTPAQEAERAKTAQADTRARAAAIAKAEEMKATVSNLAHHPGFRGLFGTNLPGLDGFAFTGSSHIAGTDSSGARAVLEQIKGKLFMDGISQMKGMGSLSDAEGAKVGQAASNLSENQSEVEALKAMKEINARLDAQIAAIKAEDPAAASAPSPLIKRQSASTRLEEMNSGGQ